MNPKLPLPFVALLLLAAPAQGQTQAAANWEAIVACVAQPGDALRHACMDEVLRRTGALDPARESELRRQDFGRSEERSEPRSAAVSVPAAPSAAPPAAAPVTPRPGAASAISGIATTIAEAIVGSDRQLLVRTAEGAVWKQVDGPRFRRVPAPGSDFSVEEGALGSYRCKTGSDVFRCRRMD